MEFYPVPIPDVTAARQVQWASLGAVVRPASSFRVSLVLEQALECLSGTAHFNPLARGPRGRTSGLDWKPVLVRSVPVRPVTGSWEIVLSSAVPAGMHMARGPPCT